MVILKWEKEVASKENEPTHREEKKYILGRYPGDIQSPCSSYPKIGPQPSPFHGLISQFFFGVEHINL